MPLSLKLSLLLLQTLRLLLGLGVDATLVQKLTLLEQRLLRTHSHRRATGGGRAGSDDRGQLQVATAELCGRIAPPDIRSHDLNNVAQAGKFAGAAEVGSGGTGGGVGVSSGGRGGTVEDWYSRGGGHTPSPGMTRDPSKGSLGENSAGSNDPPSLSHKAGSPSATDDVLLVSECEVAAKKLVADRSRMYLNRPSRRRVGGSPTPLGEAWVPEGTLLGHLHEHTARIHRLCAVERTPLFVSGSHDGSVRIWDASRTGREFPINR